MIWYIATASYLLVSLITGLIILLAPKLGFIDVPNRRSSHKLPTPKGAGIGLVLCFIAVAIYYNFPYFWLCLVICVSGIAILNDYKELSIVIRLLCYFAVVIVFLLMLPASALIKFDNSLLIFIPSLLFFSVFIVGTINFYNFMDGINGLAGIFGVIYLVVLAWLSVQKDWGEHFTIIYMALAAGCIGFLQLNLFKAKIFLGDVGSIFLGFIFATSIVFFAASWYEFFQLCCILYLFYCDEFLTILTRLGMKQSLFKAHRLHFYQILSNQAKIKHEFVSIGYALVQIIIIIWILSLPENNYLLLLSSVFTISFIIFIIYCLCKKKILGYVFINKN